MKLPAGKRKELKKKGKHEPAPAEGGGALGRLRQFEKERGIKETDLDHPPAQGSKGEEAEGEQGPGECR
jgi:hypothetical protein